MDLAYENNSTNTEQGIEKKVFSYIGLAAKAGKLSSGEFMTEKAVKEGKAKLVMVSADASDNTKKMFTNMCTYYKVPIYFFGDKTKLGHAIGKEFRASLVLLDKGLADAVEKQLNMLMSDTCEESTES
ncbi:L7Ae/L30e/S12e/Gadd45 family ribosomal protein [Anaerocolumna xylanovorans]|uniref:Ribosomal protein L7Ae n=1 Tax=Anaerocolumna xylanovorans DSM 12503 TaxID=1121345 RepID=A0A1M7YAV1_9FIRM|nr:ribosomal L7Ae/L30e/S12e/Gadd45 family protein [Anaerocolumna xylanovorans]SHO49754.1 Ribosomal protein L7Ae [Anaerocolumna xylanovorans DSM 12503]